MTGEDEEENSHEGSLVVTQAEELKRTMEMSTDGNLSHARHLRTASDSEILLNIFADKIYSSHLIKAAGSSLYEGTVVLTSTTSRLLLCVYASGPGLRGVWLSQEKI